MCCQIFHFLGKLAIKASKNPTENSGKSNLKLTQNSGNNSVNSTAYDNPSFIKDTALTKSIPVPNHQSKVGIIPELKLEISRPFNTTCRYDYLKLLKFYLNQDSFSPYEFEKIIKYLNELPHNFDGCVLIKAGTTNRVYKY